MCCTRRSRRTSSNVHGSNQQSEGAQYQIQLNIEQEKQRSKFKSGQKDGPETGKQKLTSADLAASPLRKPKYRSVNESDTLYGFSCSMSERLFTETPPREDSDIERVKITGRPRRQPRTPHASSQSNDDNPQKQQQATSTS